MKRRRAENAVALGPASLAMATLALWALSMAAGRRDRHSDNLRAWWTSNRELPSGICLAASAAWFVSMIVLLVPAVLGFDALEGSGVSVSWWGWLPAALLSAAVAGSAVNGLRHLMNEEATPTLGADILIAVLIVASTVALVGLQLLARA